jgi:hypothetical protein
MTKICLVTCVLLSAAAGIVAGDAQAAVVEKTRFKGSQVATSFSASKTIHCAGGTTATATANGFLSGSASISKMTGSAKMLNNGIFVEIDSYSNGCTGAGIGFSEGSIANGLTAPNRNLVSAALDGTTLVQDFDSGAQVSVALDVDVQGTGTITSSSSSSHTRTVPTPDGPITITITHSSSSNREGVATGTVTVDGVVFRPTFSSTSMSFSKNSEITIEK